MSQTKEYLYFRCNLSNLYDLSLLSLEPFNILLHFIDKWLFRGVGEWKKGNHAPQGLFGEGTLLHSNFSSILAISRTWKEGNVFGKRELQPRGKETRKVTWGVKRLYASWHTFPCRGGKFLCEISVTLNIDLKFAMVDERAIERLELIGRRSSYIGCSVVTGKLLEDQGEKENFAGIQTSRNDRRFSRLGGKRATRSLCKLPNGSYVFPSDTRVVLFIVVNLGSSTSSFFFFFSFYQTLCNEMRRRAQPPLRTWNFYVSIFVSLVVFGKRRQFERFREVSAA